MVPLNPNELSREGQFASPDRGSTSPGMRNDPDDAIDARCAFSLSRIGARFLHQANSNTNRRSCALTATTLASNGPATSDDRPAAAAAASRWPRFDLRDAQRTTAPCASLRAGPHSALVAAPTCRMVNGSRARSIPQTTTRLDRIAERRAGPMRF